MALLFGHSCSLILKWLNRKAHIEKIKSLNLWKVSVLQKYYCQLYQSLFHGFDEIPDQNNERKEGLFCLMVGRVWVNYSEEATAVSMVPGTRGSHPSRPGSRQADVKRVQPCREFLLFWLLVPAPGTVISTFTVAYSSSVKPFWVSLKTISEVYLLEIPNPVTLIIPIDYHLPLLRNSSKHFLRIWTQK